MNNAHYMYAVSKIIKSHYDDVYVLVEQFLQLFQKYTSRECWMNVNQLSKNKLDM